MARTLEFDITYPYPAPTGSQRRRRPRVPVRLSNPADPSAFIDLGMLLDSGADITSLPLSVAASLGIDVTVLQQISTRGVGGAINSYICPDLTIDLAGHQLSCPVIFTPALSEFLLGRERVFDVFTFAFEQSAWSIHVRTPGQV